VPYVVQFAVHDGWEAEVVNPPNQSPSRLQTEGEDELAVQLHGAQVRRCLTQNLQAPLQKT